GRVLDGVADEVLEDLAEARLVARDDRQAGSDRDRRAGLADLALEPLDRGLDALGDHDLLDLSELAAGARDLEEGVDELVEAARRAPDPVELVARLGVELVA